MKEDKFISEIGLSIKPMNMLIRRGIYWISDIVKTETTKIGIIFPGIGEAYKKEIIAKVHENGFVFKDEEGYLDQTIIMPEGFLDTPLINFSFFRGTNYFFLRRNIITVRDLINISEAEFQNMPKDKQEYIVGCLQIMKLNFAFKNKNSNNEIRVVSENETLINNAALLEDKIKKTQEENQKKKEMLEQIEKLLAELETLSQEREDLDRRIAEAFEKLDEMRGKMSGR